MCTKTPFQFRGTTHQKRSLSQRIGILLREILSSSIANHDCIEHMEWGTIGPILCMHTNCRLLLAEQPPLCLTLEPPATRVGVWATVGLQWWTGGEMNYLSLCLTTTKQSLGGWETLVGPRSPPASHPPKAPMAFERAAFLSSFESVMCFHIT